MAIESAGCCPEQCGRTLNINLNNYNFVFWGSVWRLIFGPPCMSWAGDQTRAQLRLSTSTWS